MSYDSAKLESVWGRPVPTACPSTFPVSTRQYGDYDRIVISARNSDDKKDDESARKDVSGLAVPSPKASDLLNKRPTWLTTMVHFYCGGNDSSSVIPEYTPKSRARLERYDADWMRMVSPEFIAATTSLSALPPSIRRAISTQVRALMRAPLKARLIKDLLSMAIALSTELTMRSNGEPIFREVKAFSDTPLLTSLDDMAMSLELTRRARTNLDS